MYRVGQKVKVINNTDPVHHGFEIGDIVTVSYNDIRIRDRLIVIGDYLGNELSQTLSPAQVIPIFQTYLKEAEQL